MNTFCLTILFFSLPFSCSYNLDASENTHRIIRPYRSTPQNEINNPIYFGSNFRITTSTGSRPIKVTVGAPKRIATTNPLPQTGPVIPNNTGGLFTCQVDKQFTNDSTCTAMPLPDDPIGGDAYGQVLSILPNNRTTVACSPTKLLKCGASKKKTRTIPGYCFVTRDDGVNWARDGLTRDTKCPNPFRDIIFLIDGSGSVGVRNFAQVKEWMILLANNFDITNNITRFGVVQYSHYFPDRPLDEQRFIRTEIALGNYTDKRHFDIAVRNIKLHQWTTFTAAALRKVLLDFQSSSRFQDPDTSKILILLTDGESKDRPELAQSAAALRDRGVTTFAVGVRGADETELRLVATGDLKSEKRVFFVEDFNDLDEITKQLVNEIENAKLEGTQGLAIINQFNLAQYGISARASLNQQSNGKRNPKQQIRSASEETG